LPPNGSNASASGSIINAPAGQLQEAANNVFSLQKTASRPGLPAASASGLGVQDQVLCGEYIFAAP
jgi:hypothetical protein